jgi:hypothetical protein
VGPCDGGNSDQILVSFFKLFVMITLLFSDASLLSSLVPHRYNWND